ncbi:MAG: isocitrate dehydrogenase [Cyclobacteriaceae bacterium]|jgi:isocitrate dehydrogenase
MIESLNAKELYNSELKNEKVNIAIAKGDGIGPEIMNAAVAILKAAKARLNYDQIVIGEEVYLSGMTSGITKNSWDVIRKNKVFLKAPITTPQGGGYKSLNVTMRKSLGLYANVRPCLSLSPFVQTKHPNMDVVIIRENEEDLYAGIEHQQTDEVVQCLKLITRPGCEKIVRYAFKYAEHFGRKKVTCFTKDNIMKQTDGLFHQVFNEIGEEYPEIEKEHWIVDIGAALLADSPERFDVIVMPNLYGDILSDVAAQITGSVGMGGSANYGEKCAMFEAIHGSAPDIAGQNKANPSGLIHASIQMLNYLGQNDIAENIHNAWLTTIESGQHTSDIYKEGLSEKLMGTMEFAEAVIANLNKKPKSLKAVYYPGEKPFSMPTYTPKPAALKELVGVDVFVHCQNRDPQAIGDLATKLVTEELSLVMITNRGVKVWPEGFEETFCTDHWRCRFESKAGQKVSNNDVIQVLAKAVIADADVIKTENLYTFDGKRAYSLGQGQ